MINGTLNLLRRFTIRTRMRGAIAMVLAMFSLVGVVGLLGGGRIQHLVSEFTEHSVHEIQTIATVREHLFKVRVLEKSMIIDYEDGVAVLKLREAWKQEIEATRKALKAMTEGEADEDNAIAEDAFKRIGEYEKRSQPVLDNIQNGGYDNARTADRMLARAKEEIVAVEAAVAKLSEIVTAEAQTTRSAVDQAVMIILVAFAGTLGVVVLVVVPLTLLNSHTITSPTAYAAKVAESIASGDLTRPIRVDGKDEAAQLLGALSQMQDALRRVVGQVADSSVSIRHASSEVASGNSDLSQRTEQAAGSLQQTASSMEQLTGTVRQSADSARQASRLASSAADVAQRGGQVVSKVVSTMDEINASSRKISDIIGTIDGIAFQTNILALNAAVEAARAGEQGRGFAVVAGEVRSLAQRSAEAAREIKGLIGASVEKVEVGSQLVGDAGRTMNEIVASVQRVSDIIGQISAAAAEQSAGIGQVNGAVTQLDGMTQPNAALVEQSAAAAEALREQAERLGTLVGTFRLQPAGT